MNKNKIEMIENEKKGQKMKKKFMHENKKLKQA